MARSLATALSPLVEIDRADLDEGLGLFEQVPSLEAFDAVLAATARRRGMTLVSADIAYAERPGLRCLDLAAPTFLAELSSEDP